WFNSVAVFTLLLHLTGSSEAVGLVLIIKLLPTFFAGPLAGVAADRFNRKTIMIVADLICGCVVLGFLFIERPDQVWLAYLLAAVQILTASFFEPAKSAAIPSLVSQNELISANALSSASWSVTLAMGAALGGLVTASFGRNAAFIIDSLSFFVSALFIARVRMRKRSPEAALHMKRTSAYELLGIADIVEGARYLRVNPRVAALLLVKSGWGIGGGVLLLLTVFGKQIFPLGNDGSASIGLLFAARGVGALVGPVVAARIAAGSAARMRRAIAAAFILSSVFYLLFAQSPVFVIALLCVVGAHSGGSIQWVYSTTLLQMSVEDRFLGRVFALDMALVTLTMSLSTYATGLGLEHAGLSARTMATVLGLAFLIPGAVWFLLQRWLDESDPSLKKQAPPQGIEPAAETSLPPVP
ncbi:MAG TPA: MFS transporter, partial [Blastocatellia bacterium]|nr:MFS transporter [Blastocatellia bacterium]